MTTAVLLALLFAPPVLSASYKAETLYQASLENLNHGRLDMALIGFMDTLMEEPGDARALRFMRKTGDMLRERERRELDEARKSILEDARMLREKMPQLRLEEQKKTALWKARVLALSTASLSGQQPPEQLWSGYESLLKQVPVYSGLLNVFDGETAALRGSLTAATTTAYPALPPRAGRICVSGSAAPGYGKAEKEAVGAMCSALSAEERARSAIVSAKEALSFYGEGMFAESLGFWEEVLNYDKTNPEAEFYSVRAKTQLAKINASLPVYAADADSLPSYAALGVPERAPEAEAAPKPQPRAARPPEPAKIDYAALRAKADAIYYKGLKLYASGQSRSAIELWRQCLRLVPGHQRAGRAIERAEKETER